MRNARTRTVICSPGRDSRSPSGPGSASRAWIVGICSGTVLALGFLLMFSRIRFRAIWVAVAILCFLGIAVAHPSTVLLIIQSSVSGVVLAPPGSGDPEVDRSIPDGDSRRRGAGSKSSSSGVVVPPAGSAGRRFGRFHGDPGARPFDHGPRRRAARGEVEQPSATEFVPRALRMTKCWIATNPIGPGPWGRPPGRVIDGQAFMTIAAGLAEPRRGRRHRGDAGIHPLAGAHVSCPGLAAGDRASAASRPRRWPAGSRAAPSSA